MTKNKLARARHLAIGLLALALCQAAEAAVYKCADPHNGRTFYQDKPCQDMVATRLPEWMNSLAGREEQRAFLWKAVGDRGTLYLLGSLQYGTQSMYPLPQIVMDAFNAAEAVAVETDIWNTSDKERRAALKGKGTYPPKDSLEAHVKQVTWNKAVEMGKKLGINKEQLGKYTPWMAAIIMTDESLKQAGFSPDMSLSQNFVRDIQDKKPVTELNKVEEQIKMLEGLSPLEQEQLLLQSLNELGRAPDVYKNAVEAWKHGDAEAMDMIVKQSYDFGDVSSSLFKTFYEDRNEQLANQLKELANSGKPYFIVVGAGRLGGERGILKLLEGRGFKITQP